MNPRERALAVLLLGVIILGGGGFFGYQFLYVPWSNRNKQLANLKKEEQTKLTRLEEIEAEKARLARWKLLSLPGDPGVAQREYEKYLNNLLSRHQIVNGREITPRPIDTKTTPTTTNKEPIYTKLTYNVHAFATMDNLVHMLQDFYNTGLLHEIRNLSIQRQLTTVRDTSPNELEVRMTVDALIVTGADKRTYLLPNIDRRLLALDLAAALQRGPTGLGAAIWAAGPSGPVGPQLMADPPRYYEAIAKKNIFLGRQQRDDSGSPPEWMAPRFVHLDEITTGDRGVTMAHLYDVSTNRSYRRLRPTSGFNQFPFVKDGQGRTVASGAVVKVEDRELIFRPEINAEDAPTDPTSARDGFYRLSRAERERLAADGVVSKAEDAESVLRVDRSYWELLKKQLVVRAEGRDEFIIQLERESDQPAEGEQSWPVEVVRGRVLRQSGGEVYVRPEDRYYALHLGASLVDGLKRPLPREKVKELNLAAK